MARFPPWKRDPEFEAMLKELRGLQKEYYKLYPPPRTPETFDSVIETIFLIPFAILLSPLIIGGEFKERVLDPRKTPKETLRRTLGDWREFKSRGWRRRGW